ncbi:hypothetical protein B0H10DRAFT_1772677, partial [Mycena sp. CBHHK59/15]
KSFPTAKRPKQVGAWVKNARKGTPVFQLQALIEEWGTWWIDIQPKWRICDGEPVRDGLTGSWDILKCPGPNGFLNVLICLKWWRVALPFETQGWLLAVGDVAWVLRQITG